MIELVDVTKTYLVGHETVAALNHVSLRIDDGEFVAIMGPSGSGKSTLLHVLGLLDVPTSGSFQIDGKEAAHCTPDELAQMRRKAVGFVFQDFNLVPRMTAEENVSLPLLYSQGGANLERARELLARVSLGDRASHKSNELSGGQRQRVAIARALANDPRMILADEPTGNLDSTRTREILALLKELNGRGITVVIVTHEEEIARQAGRIIRLHDGVVQTDQSVGPPPEAPRGSHALAPNQAARFALGELPQYFRQGLVSLASNKARSGLSMLGILIGVAAVVAMMALGSGAQNALEAQLVSLGSNLLILTPGEVKTADGAQEQAGQATRLTTDDERTLKSQIPEITDSASMVSGRVQASLGDRNWNTQVLGTSPAFERLHAMTPAVGRIFNDFENQSRARVAVIGQTVARELFENQNPIGQVIRLNRTSYEVIGVLEKKGEAGGQDQDDVVVVPLFTAMHRLLGRSNVEAIHLQISRGADLDQIQNEVLAAMSHSRHSSPRFGDEPFAVHNMAEIRAALTSQSRTMSTLLAAIAAISLLVGGIGIMNIMLVSVTERTREIGLRKAVGARGREILEQFLAEAVVVAAVGGLLGVVVGGAVAAALSALAGWDTSISAWSVLLPLVFAIAVGVLFGIYPARKASLLNPIEALRYE